MLKSIVLGFLYVITVESQYSNIDLYEDVHCPRHWIEFQNTCYRFVKSPLRPYADARKICQAYNSDLVTINNLDEHGFLINELNVQDPQQQKWYVAYHQQSPNYWISPVDSSQLSMDNAFLPDVSVQDNIGKDYLSYSFSNDLLRWGFEQVFGNERLQFICEASKTQLRYLVSDERTYTYGVDVDDPERVPRGPYFVKQPVDTTFDLSKRVIVNDVALSCLANGYPTPTYEWFKEDFEKDRPIAIKIDPLSDNRYTVSGGMLIIHDPDQKRDRGTYHCKAANKFGAIISESVQLNFGYILEFNLKRSAESGDQNWGKTLYCDPPQHYPDVNYYWSRDYFPNFVEEDKRVFVSYDGSLYFSALETIDRGNYSCTVQSKVSDTGRNGPFFPLRVNPHSNYQRLKFPNNFPKSFPEAPIAGEEVRLECMAFGYPVPFYNWTRKDGSIPRGSQFSSYNRILRIPKVQVQDQGEYICNVFNGRLSMSNSVFLKIQAKPNFTIPLEDKHIDNKGELTWTCEAFGIPDVNYTWWKNGRQLLMNELYPEERDRYHIQDNVFTISSADPEIDPGMYQCRAQNVLQTKYSSAQLRVLSLKPSFKKHPLEAETYASEQGNVTMVCNPEAAPRPKFVWKKDGLQIGSGGHRRILENGNLIISPVSRDDTGVYTCSASNEYGADESQGRLIVLHAPRLIEGLQPRIITAVYRNLGLHCRADSEEMLDMAYIWTHNGIRIRDQDIYNSNYRMKMEGGYLDLYNVSFFEAGDYECIIESSVGRIGSRTTVLIEGPPGPPGGVQVISIQKTSAVLQWTDGTTHGRPIYGYSVIGRTNWNNTWVNIAYGVQAREIDRYTGRKEATVENALTPWSIYEFRVAAGNELGLGEFSQPSPQHSTPPDVPYKSPSHIGGGGGKIGDLQMSWTPLKPEEQNGPGIHYKVYWRRTEHDSEFQSEDLREYGNVGIFVVHIPLDFYYTKYDIKVQAINDIGVGPESEPVTIYSAEDMPQVAPQEVLARSYNSTALNVSWQPIDMSREMIRGKLIGHRLKYWLKGSKEESAVYYLSRTTRPWALIVGLQPNTYYYVEVMAYNSAGEGPESERYLERTYRKPPQKPPSAVHVYGVNPSTVRVVWRYVQPSLEEEPVLGYKIRVWEVDQDMSTANDTFVKVGGKLEAYIGNLSPGKTYHMRVLAYSNGGDGRMSSPALTFQMGDTNEFRSYAVKARPAISVLLTVVFCLFMISGENRS